MKSFVFMGLSIIGTIGTAGCSGVDPVDDTSVTLSSTLVNAEPLPDGR